MFGTTIKAIAARGQSEALEAAGTLLSETGLDVGMCRFLPSGVAQWNLGIPVRDLPALGAMLVRAGIEMTVSGQTIFAMLCQYALHAEQLPDGVAVRPVSLVLELHPFCAQMVFDDRAMQLPLCA